MSTSLFNLPPELLIPTLSLLPIRDLLKFSQSSRYARSLANESLHTLDLEFSQPSYLDHICSSSRRIPVNSSNRFSFSRIMALAEKHTHIHTATFNRRGRKASTSNKTVYKTTVRIHNAYSYGYPTLVNLHSALLSSILARYRNALQNIEITVWAFTAPMAKAISDLSALRSLSVKIQEPYYIRGLTENCKTTRLAWQSLTTTTTAWARRLLVLKIENADITETSLFKILENNTCCRELSLKKCVDIGWTLWDFLATEWRGRDALQTLVIEEYGGMLNDTTLEAIGKLRGLQVSFTCSSSNIFHRRRLIVRRSFSIFAAVLELMQRLSTSGTKTSGAFPRSYRRYPVPGQRDGYSKSTQTMRAVMRSRQSSRLAMGGMLIQFDEIAFRDHHYGVV
jgi:hypothetical protein